MSFSFARAGLRRSGRTRPERQKVDLEEVVVVVRACSILSRKEMEQNSRTDALFPNGDAVKW
jgi:hypothetical protein